MDFEPQVEEQEPGQELQDVPKPPVWTSLRNLFTKENWPVATLIIVVIVVFSTLFGIGLHSGSSAGQLVGSTKGHALTICGSGKCVEADQYVPGIFLGGKLTQFGDCITAANTKGSDSVEQVAVFCGAVVITTTP